MDIPLITGIQLLPEGQVPPSTETWTKVTRSIRDGVSRAPPLFLWYRTSKTGRELTIQEKQDDLITELDVLYGSDRPWYGFEKIEPSVTIEQSSRIESEWLTYRTGVKSKLNFGWIFTFSFTSYFCRGPSRPSTSFLA